MTGTRGTTPRDQEAPSTASQGVWATIQLLARLDAAGLAQWQAFELLLQFGCMIDQGVPLKVAAKKTLVRATTRPVERRSRVNNVARDSARGHWGAWLLRKWDLKMSPAHRRLLNGGDELTIVRRRAAAVEALAVELVAEVQRLVVEVTELSERPASAALSVSVDEAAQLLGVGRTTVFTLLDEGAIRSVKVGNRRLVPRKALDEFLSGDGGPAAS
jgi:excisionase family DNA binding protein